MSGSQPLALKERVRYRGRGTPSYPSQMQATGDRRCCRQANKRGVLRDPARWVPEARDGPPQGSCLRERAAGLDRMSQRSSSIVRAEYRAAIAADAVVAERPSRKGSSPDGGAGQVVGSGSGQTDRA